MRHPMYKHWWIGLKGLTKLNKTTQTADSSMFYRRNDLLLNQVTLIAKENLILRILLL